MGPLLLTQALELATTTAGLFDPLAGEGPGLDLVQDLLHGGSAGVADDSPAADVVTVFGRVADLGSHPREPSGVGQVDDELHLVETLEVGELGIVSGIHERLEARFDELAQPAAQNRLLSEEVRLGLGGERGLKDPRPGAAQPVGIGQSQVEGLSAGIVVDADEGGHSSPGPILVPDHVARRLLDVVPLFATTLKRNLDELEDHVQVVIKRQYTAIHSSVEWRFREAALRYLEQKERGEASPELEQIVFHDVYPLYGLVDMRDSSRIRNEAIRADLSDQLQLALDVINAAGQIRPLPALEEVGYLLARHLDRIKSALRSADESGILELLRRDVEPLFGQLETYGSDVAERVAAYRGALDADLNIVYRRRKDFEESVAALNEAISMTLDAEEERAQAMFPHFFEKFRTDGVDHSIYVGPALHEDGLFDELYLRNLRIWQLMTTCRIEWELARVKTNMPVPLEATHLILVQHQPLSIRFRIDEKRFDVDGAYDIRYEIVKKRIDKARIRGTSERVTQPGQLAIVYSTASEAAEYRRYVEFLQSKGYLAAGLEELELEDLPGISGLKALRVTIASRNCTLLACSGTGLPVSVLV